MFKKKAVILFVMLCPFALLPEDMVMPDKKPVAIPLLSEEDAKIINDEAIETQKTIKEPFYVFYKDNKFDSIDLEGTIKVVSTIPNPQENDYPNCLYSLLVEIDSLSSDLSQDHKIFSEIILNVPIIKEYNVLDKNIFHPGDKIQCLCAEYDEMPQKVLEIQISDDIQSFEHQQYYALNIKQINDFRTTGVKHVKKREIIIPKIEKLPKDETAVSTRSARINKEIERIENELKRHGGSFDAWKQEYLPIAEKFKMFCANNWKGWINDSYYAATGTETSYKTDDYINGILPYKEYLEKNNIDLIIVRIPSLSDFAARVLTSDQFEENPEWIEHYYNCLKNDIEIIDPMPEMFKHRFDYPLFYLYNANDSHPHEGCYFLSANLVSDILSRYTITDKKLYSDSFLLKKARIQSSENKFIYPEGDSILAQKPFEFQTVEYNGTHLSLNLRNGYFRKNVLKDESNHPILLLSNSFFGSYPIGQVSFASYLSYFLKTIPDWVYQDGNTGLLQYLIQNPSLLNNRKVVVMVGHPNFWRAPALFPKYLRDNVTKIIFQKKVYARELDISFPSYYKTKQSTDNLTIDANKDNRFYFEIELPYVPNMTTCLIRNPPV